MEKMRRMGFGTRSRPEDLQGSPQVHQFRKLHVVLRMMAAHEARVGVAYSLVLRVRPDLCMRSTRTFFEFAMPRAARMPIGFFSSDGVAALPRWMADAYAEFWRSWGADCSTPRAWHADDRLPEGASTDDGGQACAVPHSRRGGSENGAPSHFFYIAGGLLGVDLHHFWRTPPANSTRKPTITLLRRRECMMWS